MNFSEGKKQIENIMADLRDEKYYSKKSNIHLKEERAEEKK